MLELILLGVGVCSSSKSTPTSGGGQAGAGAAGASVPTCDSDQPLEHGGRAHARRQPATVGPDLVALLEVVALHTTTTTTGGAEQPTPGSDAPAPAPHPQSWPVVWKTLDVVDLRDADSGGDDGDGTALAARLRALLSPGGRLHPDGAAPHAQPGHAPAQPEGTKADAACGIAQAPTSCVGATRPALLRLPGAHSRNLGDWSVEGLKRKAAKSGLGFARMAGVRVPVPATGTARDVHGSAEDGDGVTARSSRHPKVYPFRYYDSSRPMMGWLQRNELWAPTHTPQDVTLDDLLDELANRTTGSRSVPYQSCTARQRTPGACFGTFAPGTYVRSTPRSRGVGVDAHKPARAD